MRCEEVRARQADLLAGSLDEGDARELAQHLAECAECQAEAADIEALWQALGRAPAPLVPSNRMRERFAAMLDAEGTSVARRPASRLDRGRARQGVRVGGPLVQMALAASLLLAGVLVGRSWPAQPAPPTNTGAGEIAEVRGELREMRQMLTLSLLQQQSATERLRGVSWTAQIDRPDNEVVAALLDTLLHDPNVNVRLAAVDALRRFSDRPEVRLGAQRAASDRTSPLLQVAVIDFMVDTRDPQAQAVFKSLADDATLDELVRGRARWGLEQLQS